MADNQVALLAPDGRVIDPRVIEHVRATAQASPLAPMWNSRDAAYPYRAADLYSREVSGWNPIVRSPDGEINLHRDRMVARQRDLVRNDGWASGGVDRITDNTIGAHFRLIAKPDWQALGRVDSRFDALWAVEFAQAVEAEWRMYSEDVGCYADGMRQLDMTAMFNLALRHEIIDGESLAVLLWFPELVGPYGARYATTLQMIDPDRLSNPYDERDTETMRSGVEVDGLGGPIAYHVRRAEQNDYYASSESMTWDRIERQTAFGRPIVVHSFAKERTGQHRGVGVLAPIVPRFRMLGKYDEIELQQAVQQAAIRTFITSPFDHDQLGDVLASSDQLSTYQVNRADYHRALGTSIGGIRVPSLFPGEGIQTVPDDAKKSFADFEAAVLRSIASRLGLSEGQLTADYSRTNYSSSRSAMLETWKTLARRRGTFEKRLPNKVYGAWLEDALASRLRGLLPRNAPFFPEWRTAYTRCRWLGPARGWVDPVKERQGAVLGLDAGFSTLERECEEQGLSWREVVAQRGVEIALMKAEGLKLPDWAGSLPAQQIETKPEPQ